MDESVRIVEMPQLEERIALENFRAALEAVKAVTDRTGFDNSFWTIQDFGEQIALLNDALLQQTVVELIGSELKLGGDLLEAGLRISNLSDRVAEVAVQVTGHDSTDDMIGTRTRIFVIPARCSMLDTFSYPRGKVVAKLSVLVVEAEDRYTLDFPIERE